METTNEPIEKEELNSKFSSVPSEIVFVGSMYSKPDLYLLYGKKIKSTYDFYDDATKFFYDFFELMYKTFSQETNERAVNTFATMDSSGVRLMLYKQFGGWKTIANWMSIANANNVKQYYNIIKKYSLVREFYRKGMPVEKVVDYPNFKTMTAKEVYQIVLSTVNKIHTNILCDEESVVVNSGVENMAKEYINRPQMGLETPWEGYNILFRGCRLGKAIFDGMLSNEGKTRKLMQLAAYITLIKDESFLLMSNEMAEEDLRSCLLTTVINNEAFRAYHGVNINKKEEEIVLGLYRDDDTGAFIQRMVDDFGDFDETEEEYFQRLYNSSEEFRQVLKVGKWIDEKREKNLLFKDVGMDYSDASLEMEIKKHKELYGVKYVGYDTLKGFRTDDWQSVKQTATMLKELMKNENMFLYGVFQLTDDSIFTDVFDLSSNNIANAKQIKHVADHLVLNMRLNKDDYKRYEYIPFDDGSGQYWGSTRVLNPNLTYYGTKIDKNRAADKSKLLIFEVNLDYNIWKNVGYLIKKAK